MLLALEALPTRGRAAAEAEQSPTGASIAVEELATPEAAPAMPTGEEQREIGERIQKNSAAIEECYQTRLREQPGLGGKVIARLDIGSNGRVIGVSVDGLDDPPLRQCLLERIRGWQFNKPASGGRLRVAYPWAFGPQGGNPAPPPSPGPAVAAVSLAPAVAIPAAAGLDDDLGPLFRGFDAAFVLQAPDRDKPIVFNPAGAAQRDPPLSTFELFQSLVALESGAVGGTDVLEKWDGSGPEGAGWVRDETLRTAIADSARWFFQRVATRVGEERERSYLKGARYGTAEIGALGSFWLDGSLRISPSEQVDFLSRLVRERDLPFSRRTLAKVKPLFELESSVAAGLHGKSGGISPGGKPGLAWCVGWTPARGGRAAVFATRLRGKGASGARAQEITEQVLRKLGYARPKS